MSGRKSGISRATGGFSGRGFSGGGFSDGGGSSIEGAWSRAIVVAVSSRRRFVGRFIGH